MAIQSALHDFALYGQDIDDPRLYDLVVNTERLSLEDATGLLADLARRPSFARTVASAQTLTDRALAARVRLALATDPATEGYAATAEARFGVVTIRAAVTRPRAVEVARGVDGVGDVHLEIELPAVPPFPI